MDRVLSDEQTNQQNSSVFRSLEAVAVEHFSSISSAEGEAREKQQIRLAVYCSVLQIDSLWENKEGHDRVSRKRRLNLVIRSGNFQLLTIGVLP